MPALIASAGVPPRVSSAAISSREGLGLLDARAEGEGVAQHQNAAQARAARSDLRTSDAQRVDPHPRRELGPVAHLRPQARPHAVADERIGDVEAGGGVEGRLRPEGAHGHLGQRQDGYDGQDEDRQELRAAFHSDRPMAGILAGAVVDVPRQLLDPLGQLLGDAGQLGVLLQQLEDLLLLVWVATACRSGWRRRGPRGAGRRPRRAPCRGPPAASGRAGSAAPRRPPGC